MLASAAAASPFTSPFEAGYLPPFEASLLKDHQPVEPIKDPKKIDLRNLEAIKFFFESARPATFLQHPPRKIPKEFKQQKGKNPSADSEEGCTLVLSTGERIVTVYTMDDPAQTNKQYSLFDKIKEIFTPSPPQPPQRPPESFNDWAYIVKEFNTPEYQRNPEEYIQSKCIKEREWQKSHPKHLLIPHTTNSFKTLLDYNSRCDWVESIFKKIREGAGSEAASAQIKQALQESGSDMTKEHFIALIEDLLAYYGLQLGSADPKYPFQFGQWFEPWTVKGSDNKFGAFGYLLSQTKVYDLETEIRDDASKALNRRLGQVTIPPRVLPNWKYELALRLEGMQEITLLFDEIDLIKLLYLFYFPHAF